MDMNHEQWLVTTDEGQEPSDLPFLALEDTFVSGDRSGHRFRVRYYKTRPNNDLVGKILFGPGAQGPPDHVHGGAMAAILDEAMGGAAWQAGLPVVAANLDITFRQMLPLTTVCVVEAGVVAVDGRKVTTRGVLRDRDGTTVFAEGKALFVTLAEKNLAEMSGKADAIVQRLREQQRGE